MVAEAVGAVTDAEREMADRLAELEGPFLGIMAEFQDGRERQREVVERDTSGTVEVTYWASKARLDVLAEAWMHIEDHNCESARMVALNVFDNIVMGLSVAAERKGWITE